MLIGLILPVSQIILLVVKSDFRDHFLCTIACIHTTNITMLLYEFATSELLERQRTARQSDNRILN